MENIKIEELDIKELKALIYDQLVLLEQTKNNINVLQAELQKRNK